jgi:hypothetical protein
MRRSIVVAVWVAVPVAAVACTSSSGSSSDAGGAPEAGSGHDGSANCVKPGTKNNDQGIGGYCETNDDCVKGKSLCTAQYGAPDNAWFCTRLCAEDPSCGEGLYCANDSRGVVCVPLVCGVADGGVYEAGDAKGE